MVQFRQNSIWQVFSSGKRDAPTLLALHQRHYGHYPGSFERTLQQQEHLLRHRHIFAEEPPVMVHTPDDKPRGYLIPFQGRMLAYNVLEVATDDWPATLALLQYSVHLIEKSPEPPKEVFWPVPSNSSTLYLLADNVAVRSETNRILHAGWMLLINAASFAISFLAILSVRLPKPVIPPFVSQGTETNEPVSQGHFLREFGDVVHFFTRHRVLRTIVIAMFLVLFSGGISESLNYFFVMQNLHASPALYGLLSSATGIGLLSGAVLASWAVQRIGFTSAFWIGILLLGSMEVVYARLTNFTIAYVFLAIQGISNAALNVAMGPLLLHITPRQYLGRVWSLLLPVMNLATLISTIIAGSLVSTVLQGFHLTIIGLTIGPIDGMIMLSGLITCIAGMFAMTQLRKET